MQESHAVLLLDTVVSVMVEKPDSFFEEPVCGEIPCESVGAERAVDFPIGFLFRGHDGAKLRQFLFAERIVFCEVVEFVLRGQLRRIREKN